MTDINSNTETSMTDDNIVAEVEEGVIADSSPETRRLSLVSRKYDIDGDGVLDEAELKSRFYCSAPRRMILRSSHISIRLTNLFSYLSLDSKQCVISTRADADT